MLKKFLDEDYAKGFVRPSISSAASLVSSTQCYHCQESLPSALVQETADLWLRASEDAYNNIINNEQIYPFGEPLHHGYIGHHIYIYNTASEEGYSGSADRPSSMEVL